MNEPEGGGVTDGLRGYSRAGRRLVGLTHQSRGPSKSFSQGGPLGGRGFIGVAPPAPRGLRP